MSDAMKEFIASLIVLAVIGIVSMWFSSERCDAKTEGQGAESRWSPFGGCQIRMPQGWIPLENYRGAQ